MRHKLSVIFTAAVATVLALFLCACDMCGSCAAAALTFDKMPWSEMPTLYEKSVYDISEYTMTTQDGESVRDKKLAEGKLTFTLASGVEGYSVLTMETVYTYLDVEENGTDRGKTDTYLSSVTFSALTLTPVSSRKEVVLEDRTDMENSSYTVAVNYAEGKETLLMHGETAERELKLSGQVFDNEQLFFLMRAFPSLALSGSQSFTVHQPLDAFSYGYDTYAMTMSVSANPIRVTLENWSAPSDYGLERGEDGKIDIDCLNVSLSVNSAHSGSPISATYSTQPFKVTNNISTYKVLTGFSTSVRTGTDTRMTFYSLSDYRAITPTKA